MQSEDCYGSHLRAFSSRIKMVDGDNPGERGMMVAMGHGLCVCFCLCGETTKKVGPDNVSYCVKLVIVKLTGNIAQCM